MQSKARPPRLFRTIKLPRSFETIPKAMRNTSQRREQILQLLVKQGGVQEIGRAHV